MFSSHTIVLKDVKLAKRHVEKSKQLYLFSHCFGNSNSYVQIKSCDVWKAVILDWEKYASFTPKFRIS